MGELGASSLRDVALSTPFGSHRHPSGPFPDGHDLLEALDRLLGRREGACPALAGDPERRTTMGDRARAVVLQGQGATQRNYELLMPLVLQDRESLLVQPIESTMPPAVGDTDT